jgi:glycosyltransferase involved in cell wall biosynthesis
LADLPRITVVMPSYNQARYLERAIISVIEQAYPNLEFFVLDGGSTDGSADIIRRFADRIDHWQSQPDGGQTAAINGGWRRATGEIVTWLNSDDAYLPGTLDLVGRWFLEHPKESMLFGECLLVGPAGEPLGQVGRRYSRRTMLLSHQPIPQPSAFIRRTLVSRIGPLDESLDYVMDYEFFLRVAEACEPRFLAQALALATIHPEAKTIAGRTQMVAERQAVRRRYARGLSESLVVRGQPIGSAIYHLLPGAARDAVDAVRPRRVRRTTPPR